MAAIPETVSVIFVKHLSLKLKVCSSVAFCFKATLEIYIEKKDIHVLHCIVMDLMNLDHATCEREFTEFVLHLRHMAGRLNCNLKYTPHIQ